MPKRNAALHRPTVNGIAGSALLTAEQWASVAKDWGLSARELEALQCIFDDLIESAMARRMGVSINSTHTYLRRLYRKLGVTTRAGAITSVMKLHLQRLGVLPVAEIHVRSTMADGANGWRDANGKSDVVHDEQSRSKA